MQKRSKYLNLKPYWSSTLFTHIATVLRQALLTPSLVAPLTFSSISHSININLFPFLLKLNQTKFNYTYFVPIRSGKAIFILAAERLWRTPFRLFLDQNIVWRDTVSCDDILLQRFCKDSQVKGHLDCLFQR